MLPYIMTVAGAFLMQYVMTAVFSAIQELYGVVGTPLMPYIMTVCVLSYTRVV